MSKNLERLYHERTRLEAKLRKAQNDEKAIAHQVSQLTRAERTHRLCTRGGMLEAILKEPTLLTDEDVSELLRAAFGTFEMQQKLHAQIEKRRETFQNEVT